MLSVELCSGVDALYLSARGAAPQSLFADLEQARASAELDGLPVSTHLGGYPVKVQSRAWGKYRYCAVHELARIGFTPSETLPVVRFQPTAVALHALGPELTVLWASNFLDACGIQATLHVSRLDLHSDWHGVEFHANERSNFVTYSTRRALWEVAEELSGLAFGKRGGALICRIYDKSREMVEKGHDWWPDVWGPAYDSERKVTRVEFEFSRAGLKEFGVDGPEEALERAPELWAYATCSWLSLRIPTQDDTRSRWPVDPRWQLVQGSSLAGRSAPATRIRAGIREGELRTFRKLATGVLSSMAVPLGTFDIRDTLRAVEPELRVYERVSQRDFADRVDEKRRRSTP
ncbi:MAG: hypothetical protein HY828_09320 [Actinobacteria bacterium]|nr:hypothetical protein [Actinomycetota bacterium]